MSTCCAMSCILIYTRNNAYAQYSHCSICWRDFWVTLKLARNKDLYVQLESGVIKLYCVFFAQLRYLELLKLRFGESHLQFCEVMLKDVADSRRINANIHSKIETSSSQVGELVDLLLHLLIVFCAIFYSSSFTFRTI